MKEICLYFKKHESSIYKNISKCTDLLFGAEMIEAGQAFLKHNI
jgi:hypothetical protein